MDVSELPSEPDDDSDDGDVEEEDGGPQSRIPLREANK